MGIEVGGLFGLILLILDVWAIVKTVQSGAGTGAKVVWVVVILLLALWAFSKSSRRFHDWLYAHPVFGPPLQQWRVHRVIPGRAKLLSVATMAADFIYLAYFTGVSAWTKVLIALVVLYGAAFILSKPSRAAQLKN